MPPRPIRSFGDLATFATGKTIARIVAHDRSAPDYSRMMDARLVFTDGTALRVTWTPGNIGEAKPLRHHGALTYTAELAPTDAGR